MSQKELHIKIPEQVSRFVSKAHKLFEKIDDGIANNHSIQTFHQNNIIETIIYAGVRECVDPVNNAVKVVTGETLHGQQVTNKERIQALADVALTVAPLPSKSKLMVNVVRKGVAMIPAKSS